MIQNPECATLPTQNSDQSITKSHHDITTASTSNSSILLPTTQSQNHLKDSGTTKYNIPHARSRSADGYTRNKRICHIDMLMVQPDVSSVTTTAALATQKVENQILANKSQLCPSTVTIDDTNPEMKSPSENLNTMPTPHAGSHVKLPTQGAVETKTELNPHQSKSNEPNRSVDCSHIHAQSIPLESTRPAPPVHAKEISMKTNQTQQSSAATQQPYPIQEVHLALTLTDEHLPNHNQHHHQQHSATAKQYPVPSSEPRVEHRKDTDDHHLQQSIKSKSSNSSTVNSDLDTSDHSDSEDSNELLTIRDASSDLEGTPYTTVDIDMVTFEKSPRPPAADRDSPRPQSTVDKESPMQSTVKRDHIKSIDVGNTDGHHVAPESNLKEIPKPKPLCSLFQKTIDSPALQGRLQSLKTVIEKHMIKSNAFECKPYTSPITFYTTKHKTGTVDSKEQSRMAEIMCDAEKFAALTPPSSSLQLNEAESLKQNRKKSSKSKHRRRKRTSARKRSKSVQNQKRRSKKKSKSSSSNHNKQRHSISHHKKVSPIHK